MPGFQKIRKLVLLLLFAIALGLSLLFAPISQAVNPGDVQLDGEVLFAVEEVGGQSAADRAEQINQQIQAAVKRKDPPKLEVKTEGQSAVIVLNQQKLLQVYPEDVTSGGDVVSQANLWRRTVSAAIKNGRQQRSEGYLRQAIIISAVLVVIAGILHWLMAKFWVFPAQWFLTQLASGDRPQPISPGVQLFLRISLAIAQLGLWIGVGLTITSLFPLTREWSALIRRGLWTSLTSPFLTLGNQSYSLQDVIVLMLMMLVVLLIISAFIRFLKKRALPSIGISRGAIEVIALITRYSLMTLATIVLLQVWGLNLSSLTIVGSALGVGVGFGLQGIAKNLISGLVLLFERSVQVGDLVQVGDYIGTVERVSARNLIIKTLDRISIIVPSSMILEDIVVNWSHEGLTCRLHIPIGVAYGTELSQVRKLLLKAAEDHGKILKNPQPDVVFIGFGESSLDFELLVWVNQPNQQLFIKSDLLFHIDALFRKHDIVIPFPQRDLHVQNYTQSRISSLESS